MYQVISPLSVAEAFISISGSMKNSGFFSPNSQIVRKIQFYLYLLKVLSEPFKNSMVAI